MAVKKTSENSDSCIIKCNPQRALAAGYTKVKIMPQNYSKIILISGMTGKSIQDIVDELLAYAISKTEIEQNDTKVELSAFLGGTEV